MKIALEAMSTKPLHAGHYGLIMIAVKECDEVHLYVSTSDRARPGEIPILGSDMLKIWKQYIEPTLPSNVRVTYGGSPIGNIYKELGDADKAHDKDTYVLYSDPEDMEVNFSDATLKKYCPNLKTVKRPVQRTETVNVSGTKMRQFIEKGDMKSFIKNMPKNVDARAIWDILKATADNPPEVKKTAAAKTAKKKIAPTSESLLRRYVKEVLKLSVYSRHVSYDQQR